MYEPLTTETFDRRTSLTVKACKLRRIRLISGRPARCHSLAYDCEVYIVAFLREPRYGAATAQNFIVGMGSNHKNFHFCIRSFFASCVMVTSATIRPSYSAARLNSSRKPS